MLSFTNPDTAERYECLVEQDRKVTKMQVYSGPLSNIPPAMAAAMVAGKSNLVREKEIIEQSPLSTKTE